MKNRDTIQLFGHALLVEFAATGQTGSISLLHLDRDVRFALDCDTIRVATSHDGSLSPSLVEQFASAELARNAYQYLQSVIKRYVIVRRLRNGAARVAKWGVVPIAVTLAVLSLNLALVRSMEARAATPIGGSASMPALASGAAASPAMTASSQPSGPSESELAKAMQDGTKSGRYSIPLSSGPKGTLYVFSDPACSYCRALEPELVKLGKNYTIHIFPVSVIGGQASANAISSVMCRKAAQRTAAWKALLTKSGTSESPCADGDDAIAANDKMFRAIGFSGTPAILGGDGSTYPDAGHNTEATILRWLNRPGR